MERGHDNIKCVPIKKCKLDYLNNQAKSAGVLGSRQQSLFTEFLSSILMSPPSHHHRKITAFSVGGRVCVWGEVYKLLTGVAPTGLVGAWSLPLCL